MADSTVSPDTPLRLIDALKIAFPHGGMTVSGLRRERDRGRLVMFKIAGKEFTTLGDIARLMQLCRNEAKVQDYGFNPDVRSETSVPSGSSATDQPSAALALARRKLSKLKEHSPTTS